MRKFVVLCAASVAALCLAPTASNAVGFKFKTEKDAKDFKPYGAKWQVKSKAYGPTDGIALPTPSLLKDKKFKEISARASIKKLETSSRAGVMIRSKVNGTLLFGYFGGISHDSATIASARIIKFDNYNVKTSQGVQLALCQAIVDLANKKNIEFKAAGDSLGLYYNGLLVCSAKDASFRNGQAGLMASPLPGGTAASFASASFED